MISALKKYIHLFLWVAVLLAIGSVIGQITRTGIDNWYETIQRSPFTPPNYVFGIAWSINYTLIGVAGWILWQNHKIAQLKSLFIIQLGLNWIYSPVFFIFHDIIWSFLITIALVVIVGVIVIRAYSKNKVFSALLLPYLFWLMYACYLTGYIMVYNA